MTFQWCFDHCKVALLEQLKISTQNIRFMYSKTYYNTVYFVALLPEPIYNRIIQAPS